MGMLLTRPQRNQQPFGVVLGADGTHPHALGLVAWLSGNGVFYDGSLYRRQCTVNGAPGFKAVFGTGLGEPAIAVNWDGSNDDVAISPFPFLSEVTVSAWAVFATRTDEYYSVISRGSVFQASSNFAFGYRGYNGRVYLYGRTSANGLIGLEGTGRTATAGLNFISGSCKSGAQAVYINGKQAGTSATGIGDDGGQPLRFGRPDVVVLSDPRFADPAFDMRVYNRYMTAEEHAQLYAAGPHALFMPDDGIVFTPSVAAGFKARQHYEHLLGQAHW